MGGMLRGLVSEACFGVVLVFGRGGVLRAHAAEEDPFGDASAVACRQRTVARARAVGKGEWVAARGLGCRGRGMEGVGMGVAFTRAVARALSPVELNLLRLTENADLKYV